MKAGPAHPSAGTESMARTPRDKLDNEKDRIRTLADDGAVSEKCAEAILEWADALDEATVKNKYYDEDGSVKGLKPATIKTYLKHLRLCCTAGLEPLSATAADFNTIMDWMHDEQGKAKGTLASAQSSGRAFYRYHDFGVDPEDIHTFTPEKTPRHDETDMFEENEVRALRQTCGELRMATRTRALLELLIFTGQRITALLTLRMKDVDIREGYIFLNDEYDDEHGGLKGALARGRKRPMFGARKYVRDYKQLRRGMADPNDFFFIGDPSVASTDLDSHLSHAAATDSLRKLADIAGVDKPVNPHNFRHYTTTILKRDYDLDPDTIRMLLGHVEGSSTLEETYSHLFDDDYIQKAEIALGVKEDDDGPKAFTPDVCPTCGELLEDHWRRCPSCDELFGPSEDFLEKLKDVTERSRDEGLKTADDAHIRFARAMTEAGANPETVLEEMARLN